MKDNVEYVLQNDFRNNILYLYDFYVAAKCKNLKHAALLNKISYTTIGRSIRNLELKCSIRLIIPTNRGIELTNDGIKLYKNLVKLFN